MADRFLTDDAMGYLGSRTPQAPGAPFELDESYRLAQLPLVRPRHPKVIESMPGTPCLRGRHDTAWSIVLPVDAGALDDSTSMAELDQAVRDSSFGPCIAWDLLDLRRHLLHATVCAGLGHGAPPTISPASLAELAALGPIRLELRGLFSGTRNIGRLYLRVYPEARGAPHSLHAVQQILGRPRTEVFLVGLYNLTDDLTVAQAAELNTLITDWWDATLVQWTATELWLLGARDDLVLDADPPRPIRLDR